MKPIRWLILFFALLLGVLIGESRLFCQSPDSYYVVEEASSYYVVPKTKSSSSVVTPLIMPKEITPSSSVSAKYIGLDDLLRDTAAEEKIMVKRKVNEYPYYSKKKDLAEVGDPLFFDEQNKKVIYEVRDIRKIYGVDKLGRHWKKIGDSPKKWYICDRCHRAFSKLYKLHDKWVCSQCWIKVYLEENRKKGGYLMKNYP